MTYNPADAARGPRRGTHAPPLLSRLSRPVRLLDLVVAGLALGAGAVFLLPVAVAARARRLLDRRRGRRIMYLGTGQIAQVFPRNGVNLFLERECSDFGGLFEQLWNVHFPAGARGVHHLTARHHLVDFDLPPRRGARRWRVTATAVRELAFLAWVLPFASRNGVTVVTATNPYLQGLNAAILGAVLGIPYGVIITRDFDWDWTVLGKQAFPSVFPSRAVEKRVERVVLAGAALVLADRRYYRDFAVRNGALPERAVATRVLADTAYAAARPTPSARQRYGLGPGPLLVYVGRLDRDKFAGDLVGCLARVRQQFPTAQLACCGTGALMTSMGDEAERRGVGAGLRFLGALPLAQLAELVASSDVVVAPHMGYTLVEAGMTGVPIATYDYDYHGEVLQNGVSGLLAPFRDVAALADRVCWALAHPDAARALGERARERLLAEHAPTAVIPLYRAAYQRVLASGREDRRVQGPQATV